MSAFFWRSLSARGALRHAAGSLAVAGAGRDRGDVARGSPPARCPTDLPAPGMTVADGCRPAGSARSPASGRGPGCAHSRTPLIRRRSLARPQRFLKSPLDPPERSAESSRCCCWTAVGHRSDRHRFPSAPVCSVFGDPAMGLTGIGTNLLPRLGHALRRDPLAFAADSAPTASSPRHLARPRPASSTLRSDVRRCRPPTSARRRAWTFPSPPA